MGSARKAARVAHPRAQRLVYVAVIALSVLAASWYWWRAGTLPFAAICFGCAMGFLAWRVKARLHVALTALITVCAVVLMWLGSVDLLAFFERCDYCGSARVFVQVRLFTHVVLVHELRSYETLESRMAADLGTTCPHRFSSWPKRRYLGALIPIDLAYEGQGDWELTDWTCYEWYEEYGRDRLKELAIKDPELPQTFRQRVLFEHDYEYLRALVRRIAAPMAASSGKTAASY